LIVTTGLRLVEVINLYNLILFKRIVERRIIDIGFLSGESSRAMRAQSSTQQSS